MTLEVMLQLKVRKDSAHGSHLYGDGVQSERKA